MQTIFQWIEGIQPGLALRFDARRLGARAFFAFLLPLVLASSVDGQSFCVRAGAAGSNTGLDWTNAYVTLPAALQRGAVYYVAAGSYGSHIFADTESGTQTITVKRATIADHGTNSGWSDSYAAGVASFNSTFAFLNSYYVIDGATRNADWRSGYGFKLAGAPGVSKAVDMTTGNISHNTIRYTEIQGLGLNNAVHDDGIYAFGQAYLTVEYCYLHDFGRCPLLSGNSANWLVQYNVIARNSSDPAVHAEGWSIQGDNNHTIRFNIWEDIEGTGFIVCLNRNTEIDICSGLEIYGNVFMYTEGNPYHREGVGDGVIVALNDAGNHQVAQNWKIYNNSIINVRSGVAGQGISSRIEIGANPAPGVPNSSGVAIYNNFWWKSDPAVNLLGSCTGCVSQENRYDQTASALEIGVELNSVASTATFVNYTNKDFRLTAPTSAGFALPPPYNVDMLGVIRGSHGVWDRGAFEY